MSEVIQVRNPEDLPYLAAERQIVIDLETSDPGISAKRGPGGVRKEGRILGIALRWQHCACYISIGHVDSPENIPLRAVQGWAKKNLCSDAVKIGANIMYDLEWLRAEGIPITPPFEDVQFAEPLIDENRRRYSLDSLSQKYAVKGGPVKKVSEITDVVQRVIGRKLRATEDPRQYLDLLPAKHVAPYAIGDVDATWMVHEAQAPILKSEGLERVYSIECRLIPLLMDMRFRGVPVDEKRLEKAIRDVSRQVQKDQRHLDMAAGYGVNVDASASLARLFDESGVDYPRTAKTGAPSFTAPFLESIADVFPLAGSVLNLRRKKKMLGTFLINGLQEYLLDGRVHSQFHPLKGDENGTVSGRFSSSLPNLQQIPSKAESGADLLRRLFVPSMSERSWWSADWSQIEYRLIVHYAWLAKISKSDYARRLYCENPKTDFHNMTIDLIRNAGGNLAEGKDGRKQAKGINFGMAYGMGKKKLARSLGLEMDDADLLFDVYHREAPFIGGLSQDVQRVARRRGWIHTILGRRRRFPFFEPRDNFGDDRETPLPRKAAIDKWGNGVMRAWTYKALNALIQGSAADLMKAAMVMAYEAGVFDVIGVPFLTVHDELDGDFEPDREGEEALAELGGIMERCLPMSVPILVDMGAGKNWYESDPEAGGRELTARRYSFVEAEHDQD